MNNPLKNLLAVPRENRFFLTLLFLFCLLFSLTIFLLPSLKETSKRSPLFKLPVSAPVTYENPNHCLRVSTNTVECTKHKRVTNDPPENLYTVPWTYVDVPGMPFSIPLPKTYAINRGYEKNTIDLYTSSNRESSGYFGLFIDQPCKEFSKCQTQLTFDPFRGKIEHLNSFFDAEQRILVRQIRATGITRDIRYFFVIYHNDNRIVIQYYPDTDIRNVDSAWKAMSYIRIRPLSSEIEQRERNDFFKLTEENSKKIPDEWDYRTVQNLPFQLRLPSYHESTKESVPMRAQDAAESMEDYYAITFTSLPDTSFKGPIASINIMTLRGIESKNNLLSQCPHLLDGENWNLINDIRVLKAEHRCLTNSYIYDYQNIYYLVTYRNSNAPYIQSVLEKPIPLSDESGRRYFASLVGNVPVKLTYDSIFLKDPVKETPNTYRFYTQDKSSSIEMTFVSKKTEDITEWNVYRSIMDKDFCKIAETGSLMLHDCKFLPIARYSAYTFYGVMKPPFEIGNHSLLGKMFAIKTDRSSWPLIIIKTIPHDVPRTMRNYVNEQDARIGLSDFTQQFSQDPLLQEMDKIIADFSLSNR